MNNAVRPRHFLPGDGKVYKIGRMTMTFKTTAEHNAAAYTLCEAIEPPASGAGLHRHPTYDETFIICDGHYEFQLDEKMLNLGPGDVWLQVRLGQRQKRVHRGLGQSVSYPLQLMMIAYVESSECQCRSGAMTG